MGNNLIRDVGTASGFDPSSDVLDVDARLGPLTDNGGPTFTHALQPGSPAIDAGNNLDTPAFDQRGVVRIIDGNGDGTALTDIGSFELEVGRIAGMKWHDLNGDGVRDEGEPTLQGWRIELDLNADGTVDDFRVTDEEVAYIFESVPVGIHTVSEQLQARVGSDVSGVSGHVHL